METRTQNPEREAPAAAPPRPQGRAGLWILFALFALVYAPTVLWFIDRWSMGVWWHVHGFAVFPIAIWLARSRLRSLPPAPPSSSALGFALLVPAVLLQALDAMLRFEILSAVSMLLAIAGLVLLLLGRERARAIWFPLLFLGFAVPIPLFVARPLHMALRHIAAAGAGGAMDLMGYRVHRTGLMIEVGPERIEIADACSGFSTLMALLMVGLLVAYTSRMRLWRGAILMAAVVPFAVAANVLRCILLAMLIAAFGGDILGTMLHPLSGIVTFALALGALLWIERRLSKERPC